MPFRIIGPSQLSLTNSISFQETAGSKFELIQPIKSSRPLFFFNTGATFPNLCGIPSNPTSNAQDGFIIACETLRKFPESQLSPAKPEW